MTTAALLQEVFNPLFPGLMGVRLMEVTPERVVASLEVRPDLCTTGKVLHGGAIMAFADTLGAIGTIANLPKDARTTTIESKTNFLRAAQEGTHITGVCTAFHRGKTTMVWQTQIKTDTGKLCAVVTQTQLVFPA